MNLKKKLWRHLEVVLAFALWGALVYGLYAAASWLLAGIAPVRVVMLLGMGSVIGVIVLWLSIVIGWRVRG